MCANPLFLANNYIDRALKEDVSLSPMKLQKILYFTYRDYLQKCNKSLFSERFGAWKYGPVLETVYHEFKHYGSSSISNYDAVLDDTTGEPRAYKVNENDSPMLKQVINDVWDACKEKNGVELSVLTHREEGAWYAAYQADKEFLDDNDILTDHVKIV